MFDTKFRIKIVKRHYFSEDDKLCGRDLYDIYVNVGLLPPIFNRWVLSRGGLLSTEVEYYICYILIKNKEIEIKY